MKKIFTLISMALVAISVNAQEIWEAAKFDLSTAVEETLSEGIYEGDGSGPDLSKPSTLKSSSIIVAVDGLKMTAVSTPNNLSSKDISEGKTLVFWELKGSVDGNDALITDDCTPQFAQYLKAPQGNPTFQYWDWEEETDNGVSFKTCDNINPAPDIYWEPGKNLPVKGAYYKFTATKKGSLRVAIYGNKNTNPTYIVDESTLQPLVPASVTVSIYYQNTGSAYGFGEYDADNKGVPGTELYFNVGQMADDYVLQHTNGQSKNAPVLGYLDWDVEAGKTYWLFNPKSQIGIYGFYFEADTSTSIERTKMLNANDAAIFNLAGQKADKSQKGILIQNGKKFVNK